MIIGNTTDYAAIRNMEVVRPERAGTVWKGIRHIDLIESIRAELNRHDCGINNERYSVTKDEMSLIGSFDISIPRIETIDGQEYSLGFRHSNDLRYPITLSIGTHIMVCHNGVITGEHVLKRKHTTGLDLDYEIYNAIKEAMIQFNTVRDRIYNLSEAYTSPEDVAMYLIMGARQRLYPWSWIGKIDSEIQNPSINNPECCKSSAWGIYNGVSYVLKDAKPERQIQSLYKFNKILN